MSCWFDGDGADVALQCTSTARGKDPLPARIEVVGATSGAAPFRSAQALIDIETGGTTRVGTFARTSFPIVLLMNGSLGQDAATMIGATRSANQINYSATIARPEDLPSSHPAVLGEPFDFWPAAFIDGAGGGFTVMTTAYAHPLAPYRGFFDTDTAIQVAPQFYSRDVKGKLQYFVAPTSGPIALELQGAGGGSTFSLERPGYYTYTREGLRAATPEEINGDFPNAHGSPTSDDNSPTTGGDTSPDAGSPPAPSDPDPTCGGDGQARCANGSCDPSTRYNNGTCTACGADGQTYCYLDPAGVSSNQGDRCNSGTRYNNGTCTACGADGQTYCYLDPNGMSSNQGSRCNSGTRYNNGTCTTCGADGQTYCYIEPNGMSSNQGSRCNSGTRYNNGTCTACGAAGQTYCYVDPTGMSSSQGTRCNDGLHLASGVCSP